jgi:hypothetical protein
MRRSPASTPGPMREASRAKGVTSRTPSRRSRKKRYVLRATRGRRPSWRRTLGTGRALRVTEHRSRTLPRKRPLAAPVTRRSRRARPRAISAVRSATTRTRVSPRPRAPRATRARQPESTRRWSAGARPAIVRTVRRESRRPHLVRAATRRRPCRLCTRCPATRLVAAVMWHPTSRREPTASLARVHATPTNATIRRAPKCVPGATYSGAKL